MFRNNNHANLLFRNKDYIGALNMYTSALDNADGRKRALLLRNRSSPACLSWADMTRRWPMPKR